MKVSQFIQRINNYINQNWGWFFTNGMKDPYEEGKYFNH
jgi:hypothetical protein